MLEKRLSNLETWAENVEAKLEQNSAARIK